MNGSDRARRNSIADWQLGNAYVFDTTLRDDEVFLLYYLGTDYVGNFDVRLDHMKVFDHANEFEISASSVHNVMVSSFCVQMRMLAS